jgi:hypothetical protein
LNLFSSRTSASLFGSALRDLDLYAPEIEMAARFCRWRVLVTLALFALPDTLLDAPESKLHPIVVKVPEAVFWPIGVCVYLSGPGTPVGPPERHMYEGTPVQIIAGLVGIGFSWVFYSSLVFLIIWIRKYRGRQTPSSS